MSEGGKDEAMIYGLTADERDALQQGMRGLPDTMPPRIVWQRVREQGEAVGDAGAAEIGEPEPRVDAGRERQRPARHRRPCAPRPRLHAGENVVYSLAVDVLCSQFTPNCTEWRD